MAQTYCAVVPKENWRNTLTLIRPRLLRVPGHCITSRSSTAGYVACFKHLKRMLQLPPALIEQRLSMFSIYANAILSAREAAQETRKSSSNRLWDQRLTTGNILDTLEATLTCPRSAPTLASLKAGG
jgi:hypothetical protein